METLGNVVSRTAISAIWRCQASKSVFPWERMLPGRNFSNELVSLNWVKIMAWLSYRGPLQYRKGPTYFYSGQGNFCRSHYLKILFNPWSHWCFRLYVCIPVHVSGTYSRRWIGRDMADEDGVLSGPGVDILHRLNELRQLTRFLCTHVPASLWGFILPYHRQTDRQTDRQRVADAEVPSTSFPTNKI